MTLAAGAPAALEVVARLSPDVILSDIAMPGADGYALLRQVRASTPEQAPRIPAIAVTAHGRVHGPERTRAAGFDAHLRKPIDPWELCRTVAGLVRPRAWPDRPPAAAHARTASSAFQSNAMPWPGRSGAIGEPSSIAAARR